jgi:hypothetical protein
MARVRYLILRINIKVDALFFYHFILEKWAPHSSILFFQNSFKGKNHPAFVYSTLIPHKRSHYNVQLQIIHRTNITIIDF